MKSMITWIGIVLLGGICGITVSNCHRQQEPKSFSHEDVDMIVTIKWMDNNKDHYRAYLNSKRRVLSDDNYIDYKWNPTDMPGPIIAYSTMSPDVLYLDNFYIENIHMRDYNYKIVDAIVDSIVNYYPNTRTYEISDSIYDCMNRLIKLNGGDWDIRIYIGKGKGIKAQQINLNNLIFN